MPKTLTVVSTQMQIVNAIEYLSVCKGELFNYLIVCTSSTGRRNQISSLLDKPYYANFFHKVFFLQYGGDSRINSFLLTLRLKFELQRIIKRDSPFDVVIIGNYLSIIHRYIQYICWRKNEFAKFVVVDDGTATAEAVAIRKNEKQNKQLVYYGRSKYIVKLFLSGFSSFKYYLPESITFFSVYDKLNYLKDDIFKKCDYLYLKTHINNESKAMAGMELVIIGQPLIAEGFLSKERYNQCLMDYVNNNLFVTKNQKVVYIPHPVEVVEQSLNDALMKRVSIFRPEVPLEMWAVSSDITTVVGFYSSALVNLHFFLPNARLVSLCPTEIFESQEYACQEAIQAYKYFPEIGINVIHL